MAFETGHEKLGGRQKGTTNRLTKELRKDLKEIVFHELHNLSDYLQDLPTEKRMEVLFKLLPYVFPKVKPISSNSGEPIEFNMTEF